MVSADGTGVSQDPRQDPEAQPNPNAEESTTERPLTSKEIRKELQRQRREEKRRAKIAKAVMPFQSDAVELEYKKVAGGARWTLYIVVVLIVTAVTWSYWAKVDKIVISQGELVPVDQPIVIQSAVNAPIEIIKVREFDRVFEGQELVILKQDLSDSDIKQLNSDISKAEAKIARLEAELKGVPFEIPGNLDLESSDENRNQLLDYQRELANFQFRKSAREAKLAEFAAKAKQLKTKNTNAQESELLYTKMGEFYTDREKRQAELVERGTINKTALEDTRLQLKRYHAQVVELQGQQRENTEELATLKSSIESFQTEWKTTAIAEQIETQKELDKARLALKKAEFNHEQSVIRVPDDGDEIKNEAFYVIQIAERTLGSAVQAGEPLMKLMPEDAKLEVEIEVQGKDIGQISKDLPVRIKLASFEYQKYGFLDGKIRSISEGTVQKPGGEGQPNVSVYKARVTYDVENSESFIKPPHFKELPGMSVITDVNVGERRVIEYFLYPFFKHLDSSIREP